MTDWPMGDEASVRQVYQRLLAPAFPPSELPPVDELVVQWRAGELDLVCVAGDDGGSRAVAVGQFDAHSRVALLTWLAADPSARGAGLGSRVLTAALERWQQLWQPELVLAEVEHPALPASPEHGDPRARARFYGRFGGRVLDLPYFQPPVAAGQPRVYQMMLVALLHHGARPGPGSLPGAPVAGFLRWLTSDEQSDAALRRLLAAAERPSIATLALDAPDEELPRSRP